MNHYLDCLEPYPFEKLANLKHGIVPPANCSPITMALGEPQHPSPEFITKAINENRAGYSKYPLIKGSLELRQAIVSWLQNRFQIKPNWLDPDKHVLPINGSREALFAIAQCVVDASSEAVVLMPNPFYQIYEGAAILAGAKPWYINIDEKSLLPDFSSVPAEVWQRCQLLYINSPGMPTGGVMSTDQMIELLALADRYDFVIASDEPYCEIYPDENNPPPGLLQAASLSGRSDFARCLVFHSLSKRSSLPGLRSGFVAGDAEIIENFRLYRTYHGCAMPPPIQAASTIAWQDEEHVKQNRRLYRQKFALAQDILCPITKINVPPGGFYIWLNTVIDDQQFTGELYKNYNITVMPGSFLSRESHGINPGAGYARIALISTMEETKEALERLKVYYSELKVKGSKVIV